MPNISELLPQLKFITYEAALLGLFMTASIILISRDWRSLILALLGQYILLGFMLARLVRPDIAVLKVMIGAFICPILFLSARQVTIRALEIPTLTQTKHDGWKGYFQAWRRNFSIKKLVRGIDRYRETTSTGFAFRLLLVVLLILIAITLTEIYPLPDLVTTVTTAVYWLILVGLVVLTLTEDPIKVGHGFLTTLAGFDLYYSTLERSLVITGLWGSVTLLTALALGYLIVARGAVREDDAQ